MSYDLKTWPMLDWSEWKETANTLHMFLQIVGKTRLALTPVQNHWWNVPLYLTARGLWTSPIPFGDGNTLDIEFDFIDHELLFRTSLGERRRMKLSAVPVREFFTSYKKIVAELGVDVLIHPTPVEIPAPIPFNEDEHHKSYDPEAVTRFWHVLRLADLVLKDFSTSFYGKISPVHFFWGSMDLAVTRFNGRRAPARSDGDYVQAEAYSHEVISSGFWPGNGGYGQAAFYAYAAPVPLSLSTVAITGPATFNQGMGEFILNYSDVVQSSSPKESAMRFLLETYEAAANTAGWDRASLERQEAYARVFRAREGSPG